MELYHNTILKIIPLFFHNTKLFIYTTHLLIMYLRLRNITIKTRKLEDQHMHAHPVTLWGRSFKLHQLQPLGVWDLGGISPLYSKSTAKLLFHLLIKFLIVNKLYKELALGPALGPKFKHTKLPGHLSFIFSSLLLYVQEMGARGWSKQTC